MKGARRHHLECEMAMSAGFTSGKMEGGGRGAAGCSIPLDFLLQTVTTAASSEVYRGGENPVRFCEIYAN